MELPANIGAGAGGPPQNTIIHTSEEKDYDECAVCLEDFDDTYVINVTCGCGFSMCVECIKGYLIRTTKDPHCMKCNRAWDRDFQYANLSPTWINGKYRTYRKQLLLEREKARLPETQVRVEAYKNIKVYDISIQKQILEEQTLLRQLELCRQTKRLLIQQKKTIQRGGNVGEVVDKKKFLRKCPNEECRGFLSSGYKCKLCDTIVCSKCLVIKEKTSTEEHVCNPDDVKTTEAIKKETRPCPKCAVRIFKISGCDQMWCTQCNIAFSWKSGREVGGTVHNPHYYEWMRTQNLSGIRNPGEIVCGGLPEYHYVARVVQCYKKNISDAYRYLLLVTYHRGTQHILHTLINPLRERINNVNDNADLRMRYLMNEIDEKSFISILSRRDNIRQKNVAMLRIFETYNTLMIELFNNFMALCGTIFEGSANRPKWSQEHQKALEELVTIPKEIRKYCNGELKKISKNYNMKVHIITRDFSTNAKMVKY